MNRKDFMKGLLSVPVVAYLASTVSAKKSAPEKEQPRYSTANFKALSHKEQEECLRQGVSRGRWYYGNIKNPETMMFTDCGAMEEAEFIRQGESWDLCLIKRTKCQVDRQMHNPGLTHCYRFKETGGVWVWISPKSVVGPSQLWDYAAGKGMYASES